MPVGALALRYRRASTTLYTLLSAWSTSVKVDSDGDDIEARADGATRNIQPLADETDPVDIAEYGNSALKDTVLGSSHGIFDSAPKIELAGIPLGKSTMGGIAFTIRQAEKNAVIVTQVPGMMVPQSKMETINIGQRADAIAFLQNGLYQ